MSWTKNDRIICDSCSLFCVPFDEETPFGAKDYDYPEPLDPYHYCKKCSQKLKTKYIEILKRNPHSGSWQKSNAEREAANELGLIWIDSNGVGMLGTTDFANSYQYISQDEYDRLSKLPYWGYCKKCNAERKNGYCSDQKCSESYNVKILNKLTSN